MGKRNARKNKRKTNFKFLKAIGRPMKAIGRPVKVNRWAYLRRPEGSGHRLRYWSMEIGLSKLCVDLY